MKRKLNLLANRKFDVLVIGAGIHGACVARDASLRGLTVCLLDKGDFGNATSANSLKTIHGGLRYLRDGNLRLIRTMVRERGIWMRVAPQLVHPLPCLLPVSGRAKANILRAALVVNELLSLDRTKYEGPYRHLPAGRFLSANACSAFVPELDMNGIKAGALWYDAQVYNTERLLLAVVRSAVGAGAVAANYVEAIGLLRSEKRVVGIQARDKFTGKEFEVHADVVVNCTGVWIDSVLSQGTMSSPRCYHPSVACNLVTRQILPDCAIGVSGRSPSAGQAGESSRDRVYFLAPWRHYSLVGTAHMPFTNDKDCGDFVSSAIEELTSSINFAYPSAQLGRDDIFHIHFGFLPVIPTSDRKKIVRLMRQGQVIDHANRDGVSGLLSVVGVKYTTARHLAEQAVDLVARQVHRKVAPCTTDSAPVAGGDVGNLNSFLDNAAKSFPAATSADTVTRLLYNYGTEYPDVLALVQSLDPRWSPDHYSSQVLRAQVIYAVREEMAVKLTDVILRRTELGTAGRPTDESIRLCADVMAQELGWDRQQTEREIEETEAVFMPLEEILARVQPATAGTQVVPV